jgi:type I restriction enzyme M protein
MDTTTLENWLWEAACSIRGPLDAPKFKDYILPLLFYKRLSDVYEDEMDRLAQEFGGKAKAQKLARADRGLIRFYIPEGHLWAEVRANSNKLGERLTDTMKAIGRENPKLSGVIDRRDFNATEAGQRLLEDDVLARLMEILNQHRLGLDDVDTDILSDAYEYLLRKFAEGGGQSAGEFLTPTEVAILIAYILDPEPGESVYDPCCGTGGLLVKSQLRLRDKTAKKRGKAKLADVERPLRLFGQEINPDTCAMSRMHAIIHDMEAEIALGNTMTAPQFKDDDGGLRCFDKIAANPMWNQKFGTAVYEDDAFGRFTRGTPPGSSADWGWVQHMVAQLQPGGKMAVVLDTGAVSRGSGNTGSNKERDIRKAFVEANSVECVILLPENLFYNTSAPGIILVMRRGEPAVRPRPRAGEILLINASKMCAKGRPKNYLAGEHIAHIFELYHAWRAEEGESAIITKEEAARNDYNLSPSRYVAVNGGEEALPLDEALVLLAEAEEERADVDKELDKVLGELGFEGWRK